METNTHSNRLHPLIAAAAVGVLLVSLVGVAAITGVLPKSNGAGAPKSTVAELNNSADTKAASEKADETPNKVAQGSQICYDCGRVESIRTIQTAARPSGVGIAAGAVLGGVIGNQFGGGSGRTLTTVAGAVGGGYAGNEIEKRTHTVTTYKVRVRMDDGKIRHFSYQHPPEWRPGDPVRVENGHLHSI